MAGKAARFILGIRCRKRGRAGSALWLRWDGIGLGPFSTMSTCSRGMTRGVPRIEFGSLSSCLMRSSGGDARLNDQLIGIVRVDWIRDGSKFGLKSVLPSAGFPGTVPLPAAPPPSAPLILAKTMSFFDTGTT